MTSELVSSKQAGKQRILNAVLGLLLALGSYAILNTLNPALLEVGLTNLPEATIEIGGDTEMPIGDISVLPSGIICSGGQSNIPNIAKSFKGKMTYEMGAKGIVGPSNTIKLDCSGFVNYVLKCAGMPFINGGTSGIFTNQEKVTSISENKVNGKELKLGDLVGWRAVDNTPKYKYGHVMIYIGNGQVQVADSHGGSSVGNALGIFPITNYQNDIKFIKRATTSMSGTSGTTTTETFSVSYNSGQKRFYFKGNFDHNIYTYTYTAYTEDVSVILLSNQPISKYNNSQPLKDDQYEKIKGKLLTIVVYNSGNKKVGAQKLQMPN
ncbi:C40 family peptidase, partial [Patescibacteria group bacterium]|nr:C40 family peptidase [Patescibacteria group bacterium]MBU1727815.1 C40 family peptidase [Patescibacteria group bacterium]